MWKRKRRNTLGQDLADAANELRALELQLMEIAADLAHTAFHRQAEKATRMVLTLQERERQLRDHANRLAADTPHGRRSTDLNTDSQTDHTPRQ
jgi:hypothetical protein